MIRSPALRGVLGAVIKRAVREGLAAAPRHKENIGRISAVRMELCALRRKLAALQGMIEFVERDRRREWVRDARGLFVAGVRQPLSYVTRVNAGSFRPGRQPGNELPMYAERISPVAGLLIKVPRPDPYRPWRAFRWVRKARWAWEREHGRPVAPWHCVIQFDGDPENCDPANLVAVDRAVHAQLCRQGFYRLALELRPIELARIRLSVLAARRRREELGG